MSSVLLPSSLIDAWYRVYQIVSSKLIKDSNFLEDPVIDDAPTKMCVNCIQTRYISIFQPKMTASLLYVEEVVYP